MCFLYKVELGKDGCGLLGAKYIPLKTTGMWSMILKTDFPSYLDFICWWYVACMHWQNSFLASSTLKRTLHLYCHIHSFTHTFPVLIILVFVFGRRPIIFPSYYSCRVYPQKTRYLFPYQLRKIYHQLHLYRVAIKLISTVMISAYTYDKRALLFLSSNTFMLITSLLWEHDMEADFHGDGDRGR